MLAELAARLGLSWKASCLHWRASSHSLGKQTRRTPYQGFKSITVRKMETYNIDANTGEMIPLITLVTADHLAAFISGFAEAVESWRELWVSSLERKGNGRL